MMGGGEASSQPTIYLEVNRATGAIRIAREVQIGKKWEMEEITLEPQGIMSQSKINAMIKRVKKMYRNTEADIWIEPFPIDVGSNVSRPTQSPRTPKNTIPRIPKKPNTQPRKRPGSRPQPQAGSFVDGIHVDGIAGHAQGRAKL